ncbi:MAG: NUDIX domain-containing protein [bacterium]|nr:NUDIX domain-containing protein [bacterium]
MQPNDEQVLLRLLKKLAVAQRQRRPMPPAVFDALLKVVPLVTVETVITRTVKRKTQVLLTRRSKNETRYPGIWHVPGSFLRNLEQTKDVLTRIAKKELGVPKFTEAKFVTWLNVYDCPVGHFVSIVYRCELGKATTRGRWFSPTKLPASVLAYHRDIVATFA